MTSLTIAQKAAVLKAAQINLNYTNIVSPVDGTVVSRNVTAGQTVAASFQTPTLFLIATDLTKMQVDTNVSESDIAGAVEGANASFTVDAFPQRTFQGRVAQVRQAPISVQNVITYDVVIAVANPDLLLKPGMTATAKIVTAQALNVLRVPSQALRFTPAGAAKPGTATAVKAGQRRGLGGARRQAGLAVPVTVGLDDDTFAEIKSGDLKVGDQVVTSAGCGGQHDSQQAATRLRCISRRAIGMTEPVVSLDRPDPILPARRHRGSRPAGGQPYGGSRRVRRHHGIVRLGQVDPDEHHRLPRPADQRPISSSRAATWRGCPRPNWPTSAAGGSASCSRASICLPAPARWRMSCCRCSTAPPRR